MRVVTALVLAGCGRVGIGEGCVGEGVLLLGDDEFDATRRLDASDRVVEEHLEGPAKYWPDSEGTTTQRWYGDLLIERKVVDGAGELLGWEVWTRDPGGRALRHEHLDAAGEVGWVTEFVYADGRLVESRNGIPGQPPDAVLTWSYDADGRPLRLDTVYEHAPHLGYAVTWTYLAPAPSIDATEARDYGADGVADIEVTRWHDADGNVVESETVYQGEVAHERWDYGRDGRPLVRESWSDGPVTTTRWTYAERGLLEEQVVEHPDGSSETLEAWDWFCP